MRKIEIVSLLMFVAAVGVLLVALQMDYGSGRRWLFWLSVVLAILALDPARPLKMMKKAQKVRCPEDADADDELCLPAIPWLNSAVPVPADRKWLDGPDVYLRFLDKESGYYYYIHYVHGKVAETYVGDDYDLVRMDFDELFEGYETIDELLKCADNEEIEDFCIISSEDFMAVERRCIEWERFYAQKRTPAPQQAEPANRVAKYIAWVLFAAGLVGLCVALFMRFVK